MALEYDFNGNKYRPAYLRDGTKLGRSTPATLDSAGESALADAKTKIARFDPDGTALKLAFITDLHRSEDGTYASNSIDDRPSIRLLSRLCDDVDIGAVICGGDITNARDENATYFRDNMEDVIADFDDLLPYTNLFATFGNHDKRYSTSRPNNSNEWLHSIYADIQQDGNGVELHYIDDTNFYVDFTKHNIRLIFINQYDDVDSDENWYANENITSSSGIHTHGTTAWKAALPTTNKADWMVGVVMHGADNSNPTNPSVRYFNYTDLLNTLQAYVDNGGKGSLGAFAGHYHLAQGVTVQPSLNLIHVNCAYATSSQTGTADAYSFSVFVIDSETGVFHEVRVGRSAVEVPFCAYTGAANNGLLQNGTTAFTAGYVNNMCVYNGNHVRFDSAWMATGYNFTDLSKNWGLVTGDKVTSDTSNTIFSASAGDVIKTEIKFSADCDPSPSGNNPVPLIIFSPQIAEMAKATSLVPGATVTKEITLSAATNITAIGAKYYVGSASFAKVIDFELNIYKNGVRLVRQS